MILVLRFGVTRVMAHLAKVADDPRLMQHAMVTTPEDIYLLTRALLEEYRLVTNAP